jgi:ferritin
MKQALVDALNDQVALEGFAVLVYRAVSNAASKAWPGFERWAGKEAREEYGHFEAMQDYMNDRGAQAVVPTIQAPPGIGSLPKAWSEAMLRLEKQVLEHLQTIVALGEDDPDVERFLFPYLAIQTESINALMVLVERLKLAGDDMCAVQAIDREFLACQ